MKSYVLLALIVAVVANYWRSLWESLASSSQLYAWLPSWEEFIADFHMSMLQADVDTLGNAKEMAIFNALPYVKWISENWCVVLFVCTSYLIMIPVLQNYMKHREKFLATNAVTSWNLFLSLFSLVGMVVVVPALSYQIYTNGFESSVCAPARLYGHGYTGIFVFAFCMSKLFETIDTLCLLIRKSPVIALQWYHHATVMLFCWHAYAVGTGYAGMWFAGMNYTVHTFMYLYFAAMMYSKRTRELAKPFAMTITTMQIMQMVMGMVVLVVAMTVQAKGRSCFTNKANTILGLGMYLSYFLLFLKLFLDNYVFGGKQRREASKKKMELAKGNGVKQANGAKEGDDMKVSNGNGMPVTDSVKGG